MIAVKCIEKIRNSGGRILGYRVIDQSGNIADIGKDQLKMAMKLGKIEVINLEIASNGRIVDKQDIQNTDIESEILELYGKIARENYNKYNPITINYIKIGTLKEIIKLGFSNKSIGNLLMTLGVNKFKFTSNANNTGLDLGINLNKIIQAIFDKYSIKIYGGDDPFEYEAEFLSINSKLNNIEGIKLAALAELGMSKEAGISLSPRLIEVPAGYGEHIIKEVDNYIKSTLSMINTPSGYNRGIRYTMHINPNNITEIKHKYRSTKNRSVSVEFLGYTYYNNEIYIITEDNYTENGNNIQAYSLRDIGSLKIVEFYRLE